MLLREILKAAVQLEMLAVMFLFLVLGYLVFVLSSRQAARARTWALAAEAAVWASRRAAFQLQADTFSTLLAEVRGLAAATREVEQSSRQASVELAARLQLWAVQLDLMATGLERRQASAEKQMAKEAPSDAAAPAPAP